jgi:hypothetical protein
LDGQPVPDARVVVESIEVTTPPGPELSGQPIRRVETRTDRDGRWGVRGDLTLRFGIPAPDAMPVQDDKYTFTTADGRTLQRRPRSDSWRPTDETAANLRTTWDESSPLGVSLLPVFGIAGGAAQTISGHLGGMLLTGGRRLRVGVRAAAEAGVLGAGASGTLVIAVGVAPLLDLELGARYLRPWSNGAARDWIAPEIALDLSNLRLTLTLLDLGTSAARAGSAAVGIGWGFL